MSEQDLREAYLIYRGWNKMDRASGNVRWTKKYMSESVTRYGLFTEDAVMFQLRMYDLDIAAQAILELPVLRARIAELEEEHGAIDV
jgi:hypothetical protein